MTSADAFTQWLAEYKAAWESLDPERAVALFTDDATYRETPFNEPMAGRDAILAYWTGVARKQRNVRFGSEMIATTGDTGICRWWCQFHQIEASLRIDLDGIFRFVLNADGRCTKFEEWWHKRELPIA